MERQHSPQSFPCKKLKVKNFLLSFSRLLLLFFLFLFGPAQARGTVPPKNRTNGFSGFGAGNACIHWSPCPYLQGQHRGRGPGGGAKLERSSSELRRQDSLSTIAGTRLRRDSVDSWTGSYKKHYFRFNEILLPVQKILFLVCSDRCKYAFIWGL